MKILTILMGLASLYLFNSCSKEKTFDCIKSTGDIKKEDRYFENFSSIEIEENINLILVQDMPGKISIEAGENLLPKLKSTQEGTKIKVQNKNTCNWVRSYKYPITIYVGVNQVKKVIHKGYGKISNTDYLKTDSLGLNCLTYGEVDLTLESKFVGFIADNHTTLSLSGKSNSIAGSCYNNSSVDTHQMNVAWFVLENSSLLDATIKCDSFIQAKIGSSGNINCYGNPSIVEYKQLSGSGRLLFP